MRVLLTVLLLSILPIPSTFAAAESCKDIFSDVGVWRNFTVNQLLRNVNRTYNTSLENRYVAIRTNQNKEIVGRIVSFSTPGIFVGNWKVNIKTTDGRKKISLNSIKSIRALTEDYQGRIPDISMYLFTEYTTIVDDSPIVQKAELRKLVYNSIWPALRQPYVSIGMDSKGRMTINFGELTFTNGVNKVEIIGSSDGGRIKYTVYSNGDVLDLVIRGGTIKVYTVQNDGRQGARQRSAPTPSRKLIFEGDDVLLSRRNIYLPEY